MRNRMYGGVRGRKTKVGEKLLRFPPTRFAHRLGHSYPRTWSRIPVYVGMDAHVRGQKMMPRISRRRKAMLIAAA